MGNSSSLSKFSRVWKYHISSKYRGLYLRNFPTGKWPTYEHPDGTGAVEDKTFHWNLECFPTATYRLDRRWRTCGALFKIYWDGVELPESGESQWYVRMPQEFCFVPLPFKLNISFTPDLTFINQELALRKVFNTHCHGLP